MSFNKVFDRVNLDAYITGTGYMDIGRIDLPNVLPNFIPCSTGVMRLNPRGYSVPPTNREDNTMKSKKAPAPTKSDKMIGELQMQLLQERSQASYWRNQYEALVEKAGRRDQERSAKAARVDALEGRIRATLNELSTVNIQEMSQIILHHAIGSAQGALAAALSSDGSHTNGEMDFSGEKSKSDETLAKIEGVLHNKKYPF